MGKIDKAITNLLLISIMLSFVFIIMIGTTSEKINRGITCGSKTVVEDDFSNAVNSSYSLYGSNIVYEDLSLKDDVDVLNDHLCFYTNSTADHHLLFTNDNLTVGSAIAAVGEGWACDDDLLVGDGGLVGVECADCVVGDEVNLMTPLLPVKEPRVVYSLSSGSVNGYSLTDKPFITVFKQDYSCKERLGWFTRNYLTLVAVLYLLIMILLGSITMNQKLIEELIR